MERICDPAICDCCQYVGEGDFICDRHINDENPRLILVIDEWEPTESYLQCLQDETSG